MSVKYYLMTFSMVQNVLKQGQVYGTQDMSFDANSNTHFATRTTPLSTITAGPLIPSNTSTTGLCAWKSAPCGTEYACIEKRCIGFGGFVPPTM